MAEGSTEPALEENQRLRARIAELERELIRRGCTESFRSLADDSPDYVGRLDRESRHLYVNAAAAKLFGLKPEQIVGKTNRELGVPEPWACVWEEMIRQVFKTGRPLDSENSFPSKDGLRFWQIRCVPEWAPDGTVASVLAVSRDITERKVAEDALRESEERFRLLYESSIDGILLTAPDGRVVAANQAACRILNLTEEEILHEGRDGIADRSEPKVEAALEERERTGRFRGELSYTRKNGTKIEVDVSSVKFLDRKGEVRSSITFRDITNRKQAEQNLLESEARYRALLDLAPDAIVVHQEGRVVYANAAAARLYGADDLQQLAGMNILDLMHPDARAEGQSRIHHALAGEVTPLRQFRHMRLDGKEVPVEVTGAVVGWHGAPAVQVIIRDISARRQAEEALRYSEHLYRAIGESIDYGVWVCGPDGRNIYASESFLKLVGMTQEQCSDFGWGNVLHPDDAERTMAAWRECVRTEGRWEIEHRFRGVDGEWHPILARGVPVRDEDGRILCWAGINLDIGSLKRSEEAVRQREALLDAFFKASPGILNIEDEDLRYVKTDRITPTYFGLDSQSIVGRSVKELAPDFAQNYEALLRGVIETGRPVMNIEVHGPVPAKDGEVAYWRASYFPVPLPDGKRGIGVIGVEITDLKRAEQALAAAKDRLERVLATITEGYYVLDEQWRFTEMNAVAAQHFGARATELLGKNIWEHTNLRPSSPIHKMFHLAVISRKPIHFEAESNFRPSFWAEMHLYPRDGGVEVYFHDISDKKHAQQRLEESTRMLETLMEHVPEGITIADAPSMRLRMVSRYGEHLFGADLSGMAVDQITSRWRVYRRDGVTPMPDTDLPLARAILYGESVRDQELVQVSSTGERLTLLCNAAAIRDSQGAITGGIVAWRDITERKQMEDALRRSNQDLEQFAYAASHDLQEPLRTVATCTQLLARKYRGHIDQQADQFIAWAVDSATRMQALLSGLLAYSRVNNEAEPVSRVESSNAVAQALAGLKAAIDESGAVIYCDPLPLVRVPEVHLVQLFQNLIGNSIKYRGVEPCVIRISATQQGDWQQFAVDDNGIGIDAAHSERIFQIFKRLNPQASPGTGVGLSICKRIVERCGGRIWVESEAGKGATFLFTMPAG